MCTVTYFPLINDEFILTSSRDEDPNRSKAVEPNTHEVNGLSVVFPLDPQGGGTWIASSSDYTLCLLNGADKIHERILPYGKSRGLVLLDFYEFNHVDKYVHEYDFKNVEPFTLVIIAHDQQKLFQLRWDGVKMNKHNLSHTISHIWSSYMLYNSDEVEQRENWYSTILENVKVNNETLLDFHQFAGDEISEKGLDTTADVRVKTLSITQVIKGSNLTMSYHDLLSNKSSAIKINE
jgi:Transport and Golgi organisation 2